MKRAALVLVAFVALLVVTPLASAAPPRKKTHPKRPPPELVWYVETLDGEPLDAKRADEAINPASVIKVATSWWALDSLGPDHRFETRFLAHGSVDTSRGEVRGDLLVVGSGDPDFQAENAFLVARALNEMGIRRITGKLVVNYRFWTGWENGSQGMQRDPEKRALQMAARLRSTLDSKRWTRGTRSAWYQTAARRGLSAARPPSVTVLGGTRVEPQQPARGDRLLLAHHSKPLVETLRRFNSFSNNDIERVGASLGTPADLQSFLAARLGPEVGAGVRVETTSGLGVNRLTPKQIVALLRGFRATVEDLGLTVEAVLPVSGCDPGTVTGFFPALARGSNATALVGKTGTLTATDGGISALAGFLNTTQGELLFAVAAPNNGGRVKTSRWVEQKWILDLLARSGGPQPRTCGPPLATPESGAAVVPFDDGKLASAAPARRPVP